MMPRSGSLEEVLVADVCFIVSKAVLPRLVAKCCAPKGNASSRRLAQGRPVNRVGTAPAASCAHLAARRDIQMRAQLAPVAGQACAPLLTARRPARVRRSRATGGASATARRSRSQASGRGARAPSPPSGTLRPRTLTTCRSPPGRSPGRAPASQPARRATGRRARPAAWPGRACGVVAVAPDVPVRVRWLQRRSPMARRAPWRASAPSVALRSLGTPTGSVPFGARPAWPHARRRARTTRGRGSSPSSARTAARPANSVSSCALVSGVCADACEDESYR